MHPWQEKMGHTMCKTDSFPSSAVPSELALLWQIRRLHLGNNHLTGSIPSDLGRLTAQEDQLWDASVESEWLPDDTRELHLQNNQLVGSLPSELALLRRFQSMDFSNNNLSGTIPPGICWLNASLVLDCSEHLCGCQCKC